MTTDIIGISASQYLKLLDDNEVPEVITSSDSPYDITGERILLCDTAGGAITVNLPRVSIKSSRVKYIKNIGTSENDVTLKAWADETIDGDNTWTITDRSCVMVVKRDGVGWYIISTVQGYML